MGRRIDSVLHGIRTSRAGIFIKRCNIGKYKAWYQRVALYITSINFLMIFYQFTQTNKWIPWYGWLFVFIVAVMMILLIDILFIWESEQDTTASKNPKIMEILSKQDDIIGELNQIKGILNDNEVSASVMLPDVPKDSSNSIRDKAGSIHTKP